MTTLNNHATWQLPDKENWEATRPTSALTLDDVRPYDYIESYVPGRPELNRYYQILPLEEEDTRGDLLVTYLDLQTKEKHTSSPAMLGLTLTPDGIRRCWAIRFDRDD